jgi:hypothetical protein
MGAVVLVDICNSTAVYKAYKKALCVSCAYHDKSLTGAIAELVGVFIATNTDQRQIYLR